MLIDIFRIDIYHHFLDIAYILLTDTVNYKKYENPALTGLFVCQYRNIRYDVPLYLCYYIILHWIPVLLILLYGLFLCFFFCFFFFKIVLQPVGSCYWQTIIYDRHLDLHFVSPNTLILILMCFYDRWSMQFCGFNIIYAYHY